MAKKKPKRKLSAYQKFMKSYLKGKMKGKTARERKRIFQAGVDAWNRSKLRKSSNRLRAAVKKLPKRKKRGASMAKKKRSRARSFLSTQTISRFIRLGALVGPGVAAALGSGTPEDKLVVGMRYYTGFNIRSGTFSWSDIMTGWLPFIATNFITWGASKLAGIIRRL